MRIARGANARHDLDDRAPHRHRRFRAEQARAALRRHPLRSQPVEIVETLRQKPLSFGRRKSRVPFGYTDEDEAEHSLRLLRGETGRDQRAERLSDEIAAIDAERAEP